MQTRWPGPQGNVQDLLRAGHTCWPPGRGATPTKSFKTYSRDSRQVPSLRHAAGTAPCAAEWKRARARGRECTAQSQFRRLVSAPLTRGLAGAVPAPCRVPRRVWQCPRTPPTGCPRMWPAVLGREASAGPGVPATARTAAEGRRLPGQAPAQPAPQCCRINEQSDVGFELKTWAPTGQAALVRVSFSSVEC